MKYYTALVLLLAAGLAQAQSADVDWTFGSEEMREPGLDTPVIGKRWGVFARSEGDQLTFKLEILNDMKRGGWSGDFRSAPRVGHFKIILIDADGHEHQVEIDRLQAIGPASENGRWKPGPSSETMHVVVYRISWDEIAKFKQAKAIRVNYSTFEQQDVFHDTEFSQASFRAAIETLEADVAALEGGRKFVLTQAQIDNMPINQLPPEIYAHWERQIEQVAREVGLTVAELTRFSMVESRKLHGRKMKEKAEARRLAEIEAQKVSESELQQIASANGIAIGELRGLTRDQVESKVYAVKQQRQREQQERERLAALDRKYGQKLRGFEWPYLGCSRPEMLAVGASDYQVERANRRVNDWSDCMEGGFRVGLNAVRRLIDDLGGSWKTAGDQWSWSVPGDCECRDQIRQLVKENEARHERRVAALGDFYDAIDRRNQRQDSQNANDEAWNSISDALNEMEADMERMNRQRQNQWNNQLYISPGYN